MARSLTLVEIDVPSFVGSPETIQTWRFALPTDYLPPQFDAVPSLRSLDVSPAVVSLGEGLGERANITATFEDHRHRFVGEPWGQGTFWGKWRAKPERGRCLRHAAQLGDGLQRVQILGPQAAADTVIPRHREPSILVIAS